MRQFAAKIFFFFPPLKTLTREKKHTLTQRRADREASLVFRVIYSFLHLILL